MYPKFTESMMEGLFDLIMTKKEGQWIHANVQPCRNGQLGKLHFLTLDKNPYRKIGICPHYDLLKICAELIFNADIRQIDSVDHFCGVYRTDNFQRGQRVAYTDDPSFYCAILKDALEKSLQLVRSRDPKKILISKTPDEAELKKVKRFVAEKNEFNAGQEILKFWRKQIIKIDKARREAINEEVIRYASNFYNALSEQVTGKSIILDNLVCVVAPKHHRNQFVYMD